MNRRIVIIAAWLVCIGAVYFVANTIYVEHQRTKALHALHQVATNFDRATAQLDACTAKVDKQYSWTSDKSVTEKEKCLNQFDQAP